MAIPRATLIVKTELNQLTPRKFGEDTSDSPLSTFQVTTQAGWIRRPSTQVFLFGQQKEKDFLVPENFLRLPRQGHTTHDNWSQNSLHNFNPMVHVNHTHIDNGIGP